MDKQTFLAQASTLRTALVAMRDGSEVEVRELTVRERGKLRDVIGGENPADAQAQIVAMGCPLLEGDAEAVMDLPGGLVSAMADMILKLSGLTEDEGPKAD